MKAIIFFFSIILYTNCIFSQEKVHPESYHFYKIETSQFVNNNYQLVSDINHKVTTGFMTFSNLNVYINTKHYSFTSFHDFGEALVYKNNTKEKYYLIILHKSTIDNKFNAQCYYLVNNVINIDTYYFN